MKTTKMTIFEHLISTLRAGDCGEYGLNFRTWMNGLTCPLMSKHARLKQVPLKGPYKVTTKNGTKLVKLTPSYINAIFWSTGKK